MAALMIDAAGALDRDDAIEVIPVAGGFTVRVLVACVADHVPYGSDTDRQAAQRGASLYLPNRTVAMLGREVEQAATLSASQDRSALEISFSVTSDGELSGGELGHRHVPAGECVSLEPREIPAILADPTSPHHAGATAASAAARSLAAHRRTAGSFVVYDQERGLVSTEDGQLITLDDARASAAYVIVQELMIAANQIVAEWAVRRELPIIFRNHRRNAVAPLDVDRVSEVTAALTDPFTSLDALEQRVNLAVAPATYDAVVLGHHGLQVRAYTHATSPLRRYADLVTQRIVLASLQGLSSPYRPEQTTVIAEALTQLGVQAKQRREDAHAIRRRRETARNVSSASFGSLDDRAWLRVLRLTTDSRPPDGVIEELRRRAFDSRLHGGHLAQLLLTTEVPAWAPVRREILGCARERQPMLAASIVSAWQSVTGQMTHPPEWEGTVSGPPHQQRFAARATLDGKVSRWHTGETKKAAQQQALWDVVETIADVRGSSDPGELPPAAIEPELDVSAPPSLSPAAHVPTQESAAPELSAMLGTTATQRASRRDRALSNPVAWLHNLTIALDCAKPTVTASESGPPHQREFEVQIVAGPATGIARAASKQAAKTAAARAAVVGLFNSEFAGN